MPKQIIAAFDFDGTITSKDMLLPFIRFLNGPVKGNWNIFCTIPNALLFLLGFQTRGDVKESLMRRSFKGLSQSKLLALGKSFSESLGPYIYQNALKAIEEHRLQGHTLAIVSANLNPFLIAWCNSQNIPHLFCSEVQYKEGVATGKLAVPNCWGQEKVNRLIQYFGPKSGFELYAYGDSLGDKELLDLADHPFYRYFKK